MAAKKLKASVLAFERKLDPSNGIFSSGNWEDRDSYQSWSPITISEKSVRGTISNRLKAGEKDPVKLDAAIEKPNLQTVDVAALGHDADTLCIRLTLRILGGVHTPAACNHPDVADRIRKIVDEYQRDIGWKPLSQRYAQNIASGRFLWRNRLGAEAIEIQVSRMVEGVSVQTWTFDGFGYPLAEFKDDPTLCGLTKAIESGLSGDEYVLFDIAAFARIGAGQEIFPSQELVLDKSSGKGAKSKTLFQIGGVAAMHSQKIGNALRTIDSWYQESDEGRPIAVEPYGSVTSEGRAYRQPKEKRDFYNLFDGWVVREASPERIGDKHYVIATLLRGGVFGESGKDNG